MRVQLIYTPGCNISKKTLDNLQTVIAEERLPIPIDLIEKEEHVASHTIRIEDDDLCELPVAAQGEFCRLYNTKRGEVSAVPCVDQLREILFQRWKELTEAPLLKIRSS